jgi:hypothetical protein
MKTIKYTATKHAPGSPPDRMNSFPEASSGFSSSPTGLARPQIIVGTRNPQFQISDIVFLDDLDSLLEQVYGDEIQRTLQTQEIEFANPPLARRRILRKIFPRWMSDRWHPQRHL